MSDIETVKTIAIIGTADASGTIICYINIDFIPDELIVKSVCYYNDFTEARTSYIWSDLVDGALCSVADYPVTYTPQTRFTMKKNIRGDYVFRFLDANGQIKTTLQGDLVIMLEFVKYKQKGKVY